jgi:hypothetical protein
MTNIKSKLLNVQSELKAPKNQFNNFGKYKYRNQEDILESVKPLLNKHKLSMTISDEIHQFNEVLVVQATVCVYDDSDTNSDSICVNAHAGIDLNKKGMDIAQSFGSSSSYARKYALNGMFLIDDTKDADSQDNAKNNVTGSRKKSKLKLVMPSDNYDKVVSYLKQPDADINLVFEKYDMSVAMKKELKSLTK